MNIAGYFPVKKKETTARQKLNISRNLLKDIENDFDEFDDFLNADKAPTTIKPLDEKYIKSLSTFDQMALKFKQNNQNYKDVLEDYENLEFFVEDKEEEERKDQVRSLQEYNSIIHDIMGYSLYFNKLFLKFDASKMESILNEHKVASVIDRRVDSFVFGTKEEKHWVYNSYSDKDLLMTFEERKAVYEKFDLWLESLQKFYGNNNRGEPVRKRQKTNRHGNSSESKDKTYPIHNEINVNVLVLLQVLFILANDFLHNNMKYQYAFNPVFDLNNYLSYIKNNIPIIYEKLSDITLKELNTFKFFKGFLDKSFVNDYHIGLFMKLELLPQNIVNIFREVYYGNDFEKFINETILLDVNNIEYYEREIMDLQDPEINKMEEDPMIKTSLQNIQNCIKMEETHLLSIKRAIKIQNYFINRPSNDELYKQLKFLQSIITGKDVKFYKHLAMKILKDLHELKVQHHDTPQSKNLEVEELKPAVQKKKAIKLKSSDGLSYSDDEDDSQLEIDDTQATSNNYGFSKDSLPDLYIKRLVETKLISCDKPQSEIKKEKNVLIE